jgi:hypothetical protein
MFIPLVKGLLCRIVMHETPAQRQTEKYSLYALHVLITAILVPR